MSKQTEYFSKFPIVHYNDLYNLRNILTRVRFTEKVLTNYKNFYDYTMEDGERIEHVAYNYYDNVDYQWLIFLANEIVDPFYDVYLSEKNFKEFIIKKYGSIVEAKQKILFYRNNWSSDDSKLSISGYSALPSGNKKYWDPIEDAFGEPVSYQRKREDYIINTNMVGYATFEVANTFVQLTPSGSNTIFEAGEKVVRDDDLSTYAIVTWANTTAYRYHHVFGDFSANTSYSITGSTSGVSATINCLSVSTTDIIPSNEQAYYSPVYAYDLEEEKNLNKKEIRLVARDYATTVNEQLDDLL